MDLVNLPKQMIPFSKAIYGKRTDAIICFYEADQGFVRIRRNPSKYVDLLKRFPLSLGPDFSQKIGYTDFVNFCNSWWNKAFTAYYQLKGVPMIINVTWSTPDSLRYAFIGLPKHSVVAVNCTAIKSRDIAKYFWYKGYEKMLEVLDPSLILRYGDRMPYEDDSRSIYFENINLKNLRNGR